LSFAPAGRGKISADTNAEKKGEETMRGKEGSSPLRIKKGECGQ